MAIVFSGMVDRVMELESIQTSNGNTIRRRKVVIKTVEEYPQSVVVTLKDELAEQFNLTEGMLMTAYLKFRTFTSKDTDVVFNDIQCWKFEKGGRV